MQTTPDPGNTCLNAGHNGQTAMQQFFDLGADSHVVVYFTFEWALLSLHERGHISMGCWMDDPKLRCRPKGGGFLAP
jgi:hypothetical protein